MKRGAGFTLIELLITITLMVILLGLTVVSLRSNQAHARDEERKSDIIALAEQLESYYTNGSNAATSFTYTTGQYPPTAFLTSEANIRSALQDIDVNTLHAPGSALSSSISLTMATSASTPNPDVNTYVYQPLDRNGALCSSATAYCSKFTLYYKLETDSSVQSLASKHQ